LLYLTCQHNSYQLLIVVSKKSFIIHQLFNQDGFGGEACERVTKLNLRTPPQKLLTSLVIVAGGVAIFGALIAFDSRKKTSLEDSSKKCDERE
jgi:hypothetical protein